MDEQDLLALRERMGDDYLGRRLRAQVDRSLQIKGQGRGGWHFENFSPAIRAVGLILRLTGLLSHAQRNALALTVHERRVTLPGLSPAFDGLRVLHLSDLHLDGYPGFGGRIAAVLAGHRFDLVVLTGDYRFYDAGRYEQLQAELTALMPALACRYGVFGILGNHDFIEMAPLIERAGVHLLLNESAALEQGGARLWVAGVDDAHFYGLNDFDKAVSRIPMGEAKLVLVHSPEVISEAASYGFLLYLSGHTHGGQMCLPGGRTVYQNVRCTREQIAGAWRYGDMEGYTSAGVGASGVFGRFFCPPEVVIHELRTHDRTH